MLRRQSVRGKALKRSGSKRARLEGGAAQAAARPGGGGAADALHAKELQEMAPAVEQKHEVFQRYCHVYRKGDLEALVELVPNLKVLRTYFDCSNWAIVVERV